MALFHGSKSSEDVWEKLVREIKVFAKVFWILNRSKKRILCNHTVLETAYTVARSQVLTPGPTQSFKFDASYNTEFNEMNWTLTQTSG